MAKQKRLGTFVTINYKYTEVWEDWKVSQDNSQIPFLENLWMFRSWCKKYRILSKEMQEVSNSLSNLDIELKIWTQGKATFMAPLVGAFFCASLLSGSPRPCKIVGGHWHVQSFWSFFSNNQYLSWRWTTSLNFTLSLSFLFIARPPKLQISLKWSFALIPTLNSFCRLLSVCPEPPALWRAAPSHICDKN